MPAEHPAHSLGRLSIRLDLPGGRIGPGKVRLLEAITAEGSISAAARTLGMSYRRAWALVEETGRALGGPVVATATGGAHGGGAVLTPRGLALVQGYRDIERAAAAAATAPLRGLTGKAD
jgi:molybdate transport system regulatory protein